MSAFQIAVEGGTAVRLPTAGKYCDRDIVVTAAAGGYDTGYADGKQAEHDRFWDAYQQNGNKTNYDQAFAYGHWNDDTYDPKYDIVCGAGVSTRQAFYNGRMTSTKVPIRVKNTTLNSTFAGSTIKTIVLLELVGVTGYNNPFSSCAALENITIAGSIDVSVSLSASPLLTQPSVQSIIDHLKDLTGQTAQTLTLHADVGARLTDAQKATVTAKNWTLVY